VSRDDGRSLNDRTVLSANGGFRDVVRNTYYVEDDTSDSYCYPAIQETRDGFLVAYYHSDGVDVCLNATKMVKIHYDELT